MFRIRGLPTGCKKNLLADHLPLASLLAARYVNGGRAVEGSMAEFRTIEIDFDIHKKIEEVRRSFDETPNEALRRLLKLPERAPPKPTKMNGSTGRSWAAEGVTLPHGTAIRMKYNKRLFEGEIVDGRWVI